MRDLGRLITDLATAGVEPSLIGRVADLGAYGVCDAGESEPEEMPVPEVTPAAYRPPELAGAAAVRETWMDGYGLADSETPK